MTIDVQVKPVSIAQQVNRAQGSTLPLPPGIVAVDCSKMEQLYFHGCIFGGTNVRKTYTACTFAPPEDTAIITVRNESQLIPLRGTKYQARIVRDWNAFEFCCMYPERVFGADWAARANRTIVIDDISEVNELALEDNSTNEQGKEFRDARIKFRGAKESMRGILKSMLSKPQNVIFTALVRTIFDIRGNEILSPDVSPAIFEMLGAEIEYAFYIDDKQWKFLTQKERFAVTLNDIDPATNQKKVVQREIFAKYKQPKDRPPLLQKYEDMDISAIWNKVRK